MAVFSLAQYSRGRRDTGVPKQDKFALAYAEEFRDYCLDSRYQYEDEWLEGYELYSQISRAKKMPGRANLFVPIIYQTIETMIPDMLLALFTYDNIIRILPVSPEFAENAKMMQKAFEHNMKVSKLFMNIETAVRDALTYGDSVCKVPLHLQFDSFGRLTKYPAFVPQDPWDVALDPGHWEIQKMHGVCLRAEVSGRHLQQMQRLGVYKNVSKAMDTPPLGEGEGRDGVRERLAARGLSAEMSGSPQLKWEIWEHWIDDRLITTVNDSVVIRNVQNPFMHGMKPFVKFTSTPRSRETYNQGIPKLLNGLQKEMNLYRNARLDNILLSMNGMFAVERTARINASDLVVRPGAIVRTDDVGGIREMKIADVPHTAFMETEAFDRDVQKTTGVWDYMQGATPTHEETATGIIRLQQAAGQRLSLLLRRMQEGPLPEYAEMACRIIQQFADDEMEIPGIGQDGNIQFTQIYGQDLQGDFTFEFTSRPEDLDPNKRQNDAMALYNLTSQNPLANQVKLLEDLYRSFGKENWQEYLNPQALQALQVQTQMLGQPNAPGAQSLAMMLGPGGAGNPAGLLPPGPMAPAGGQLPQGPAGGQSLPPEILEVMMEMLGGMGGAQAFGGGGGPFWG